MLIYEVMLLHYYECHSVGWEKAEEGWQGNQNEYTKVFPSFVQWWINNLKIKDVI